MRVNPKRVIQAFQRFARNRNYDIEMVGDEYVIYYTRPNPDGPLPLREEIFAVNIDEVYEVPGSTSIPGQGGRSVPRPSKVLKEDV